MVSIELGKLVGKGGFSEVYEGVYRGRRVAVKVLDKTWLSSKRLLGRAREEVRLHLLLSSHLHKPNSHRCEHGEKSIVEALDSFEDEDKIYLVLELCEKGNLYSWIKKHRPLEREVVVRWFREIVEAVSFLHANDIVHRDLKLSNILLSDDGHAKVSDFGLATTIEDREHHTVCGTPNYMAPEVRFHDKKSPQGYDPVQADLWSLGCLLFALLHDGKHFDPKSKYKRTERIEDDNAHQLLSTLLNRKQERSSAREILDHPFLRGRRDPEKSKETARMSYVRIDTGLIRGVQHTFGSHKVHITRDGRLFVSVPRKQSDGQQENAVKQIEVKEWMHAKYNKLQRYCAKAVEILKNATPRVVLRISYPEAVIAAVVGGVGRVWFEQRNLHATYDLSPFDMSPIEEPVVMVGKEKITLEDVRHAPQWVGDLTEVSTVNDSFATRLSQHRTGRTKANLFELVQDLVLRCLEIEEDLHLNRPASGPPVGYPVIVNDDQVSVKGVGVGVRDPQGTVSVCLHDGTHITLEKMGNTIRCDDTSYALFKCPENLHLPLLPPHLRKKLRKAQTILRELATK